MTKNVDYSSWMGHKIEYVETTLITGETYWYCKFVEEYLNEGWFDFAEGETLEECQRNAFEILEKEFTQHEMDI